MTTGVQATPHRAEDSGRRGSSRRSFAAALVAALLALTLAPFGGLAPQAQAAAAPRAVVIVGPSGSSSTPGFLGSGAKIADQAQAAGMNVTRIFHPKATAERVLNNIQGANLVVYIGHGNGWPSPYAPFQERTKNGLGLNPFEGSSAGNHKYYGANWIRSNVKLAPNAVVILLHLCYSSGNAEPGMAIPGEDVARQRVDNYAAGFLAAGAGAVFSFGWFQRYNVPQLLMGSNKTMDEIFMVPGTGSPTGFIGWKDTYHQSQRMPGNRNHLDRHSSHGYYRALSGDLGMTANQFRNSDGSDASSSESTADTTPPSAPTGLDATLGSGRKVTLSWNASTDDRDGTLRYRIIRNGSRIATTTSTTFIDTAPADGTFNYKVRARDAAGNLGPFSSVVSVQVTSTSSNSEVGPSVPGNLTATSLGYRYVELKWKASSGGTGTIKYRIFRNGVRIKTVTTLSYVDRPDTRGTYYYKIRAIDSTGKKSAFTPVVEGKAVRGAID